jgi:hypothetical protein
MKRISLKSRCVLTLLLISLPLLISAGREDDKDIEYDIPSVSLTLLSEKPLTIGDPIDLALTVYHDKKESVEHPKESSYFTPFMVRNYSTKSRKVGPRTNRTIVLYTLSVYQTGDTVLSPLPVTVGDRTLDTEELTIRILSVLPADGEDPELRDIVPPYRARIKTLTVVIILCGIAVAAALFIVARKYLFHTRQVPKTIIESEASFDPFDYSIRELESIRREHKKELADSKRVYTTISHSLKLFFGSLFTIEALEMTTSELKRYLKRSGNRRNSYIQQGRLISLLHRSDMVKFARENPPHSKIEQDIDQSISIIKEARVHVQGEELSAHKPAVEESGNAV